MLEPSEIGEIGYSNVYKTYWSHVHENEATRYPMSENIVTWNENNMCTWERKVIEEGVNTYLPKDK